MVWTGIISGAIVGIFSLLSIWLTNIHNDKQMTKQLQAQERQLRINIFEDKKYESLINFISSSNELMLSIDNLHGYQHENLLFNYFRDNIEIQQDSPLIYTVDFPWPEILNPSGYLNDIEPLVSSLENNFNKFELTVHNIEIYLSNEEINTITSFAKKIKGIKERITLQYKNAIFEQSYEHCENLQVVHFLNFTLLDKYALDTVQSLHSERENVSNIIKSNIYIEVTN